METMEYISPYLELELEVKQFQWWSRDPVCLKSKLQSLNLPLTIQCVLGNLK